MHEGHPAIVGSSTCSNMATLCSTHGPGIVEPNRLGWTAKNYGVDDCTKRKYSYRTKQNEERRGVLFHKRWSSLWFLAGLQKVTGWLVSTFCNLVS